MFEACLYNDIRDFKVDRVSWPQMVTLEEKCKKKPHQHAWRTEPPLWTNILLLDGNNWDLF